jgi:hypothetical protein
MRLNKNKRQCFLYFKQLTHVMFLGNANTRKLDSVYVLFCAFKMFKMIERPADCEIRYDIRCLNARNVKPAVIHRQICEVYGENTRSGGMVRNGLQSSTNVVITCMTSRGAAGRLWSVMSSQAATLYEEGTQKLVPRCDKCLKNGGNCVEK